MRVLGRFKQDVEQRGPPATSFYGSRPGSLVRLARLLAGRPHDTHLANMVVSATGRVSGAEQRRRRSPGLSTAKVRRWRVPA